MTKPNGEQARLAIEDLAQLCPAAWSAKNCSLADRFRQSSPGRPRGVFGHDRRRQLFCDRDLARRAHGRDPRPASAGPRRHSTRRSRESARGRFTVASSRSGASFRRRKRTISSTSTSSTTSLWWRWPTKPASRRLSAAGGMLSSSPVKPKSRSRSSTRIRARHRLSVDAPSRNPRP